MEDTSKKAKENPLEEVSKPDNSQGSLASSRARNKTVMLTPELTGQVRALLGGEGGKKPHDPLADILPPASGSGSADSWHSPGAGATEKNPTGPMQSPATGALPRGGQAIQARAAASSKIIGFLVSFDTSEFGEVFEIRVGRWLVSSRGTEHGDSILIADDSISPLHAILRATEDGKVQILDQLSEFGTGVQSAGSVEEKEVTGSMVDVGHGDKVRFGKRHFVVCVVPELEQGESSSSE